MAVAFDAQGSGVASGWSHTNSSAGNAFVVAVRETSNGTVTAVSYGGTALSKLGFQLSNTGPDGLSLWGRVGGLPTGANTVTVTGFTVWGGSCSYTGAASFTGVYQHSAASGNDGITATGTTTDGMVVAGACNGGAGSASSWTATSPANLRWQQNASTASASGNGMMEDRVSAGGGSSTAVAWTNASNDWNGTIGVEILPGGAGALVLPQPGGPAYRRRYRRHQPQPAPPVPPDASPTAGLAAATGAALDASAAIQNAAVVPVLPQPGGEPFRRRYRKVQQVTPAVPPAAPYVTGLASASGTSYFTDQYGSPRLLICDNPWAILAQAGTVGGSASQWQSDMDNYLATRAGQGVNGVMVSPYGNANNQNTFSDGRNIAGSYPFSSGATNDPSSGLSSTFWNKVDYFITKAASLGITVVMNIAYSGGSGDMDTGGCLAGKTTQQYTDYGTAVGNRYKNQPNIIWTVGNDYFGSYDTAFTTILAALRAAGDTHLIAVHNMPESTSRFTLDTSSAAAWGTSHSDFNFCYTYDCEYLAVEYAYGEAAPLTVFQGDGYFYQGNSGYQGGTSFAYDRSARQEHWWSLASGARGHVLGDEGVWQWPAGAQAQAATGWFWVNNVKNIRTVVEGLAGWQNLIPDTGNALVTAGRGTRNTQYASGGGHGQYEPSAANAYVAASVTPDGSLALLYLPKSTTITIAEAMVGGAGNYTATWVDPVSGATSAATTGTTYNSTAKGNNSQGDPDWVLVLQGPTTADAGLAAAAGTAQPPAAQVTALPGTAAAAGAAFLPGAGRAPGAALATGAAQQALALVTASDQTGALATGAALQPFAQGDVITVTPVLPQPGGESFRRRYRQVQKAPPSPPPLFLTNSFEGGSNTTAVTAGNSGGASGSAFGGTSTVTFSSTQAAHGALSAKLTHTSGVNTFAYVYWDTAAQSRVFFRMYLYITSTPTVTTRIWQAQGGTGFNALYVNTAGKFLWANNAGGTIFTSANAAPQNQWIRVEGMVVLSATAGQVELRVYNSMDGLVADEDITSAASQNTGTLATQYIFGDWAGTTETATWTYYQDDIGLSAAGWLGPAGASTFTVTAGTPSTIGSDIALKVLVVTGVAESGGASNGSTSFGAASVSLNPVASGSLPVLGLYNASNTTTFTPLANSTLLDNRAGSNAQGDGYYSGTVTAGTPVTVGVSAPSGAWETIAAYELQKFGGTPAVDAATPALATGTGASVTSPAFAQPSPGTVLVAILMSLTTAAGNTVTVSDTSGLGLTWTKRADTQSASEGNVTIFTATMPGGSVTANAGLASATGAAYNVTAVAAAGAATATGAAQQVTPQVTALAGLAPASGTALQPVIAVDAFDQTGALATGAAYPPSVASGGNITASAGTAVAAGAAFQPSASVTCTAGLAAAAGAAFLPGAGRGAGAAAATGTAQQAAVKVTAVPALAPATGAARQPAVTAGGDTTVAAGLASAAGAAYGALYVVASPVLTCSGFGTFPQVPPTAVILSVVANIVMHGSDASMAASTYELWDGTSARIDARQGAASTAADHRDSVVFTGMTYSQLATLQLRIYAASLPGNSGAVASVDAASLSVNWVPNADTLVTPGTLAVIPALYAPAVSGVVNATVTPGVLGITPALPDVDPQGLVPANVFPVTLAVTPALPAPDVSASVLITPGVLAVTPALPVVADVTLPNWTAAETTGGAWVNPANVIGPPDGSSATWVVP